MYAFKKAIASGDYFPLWAHHIGIGMPLFLFYSPLFFYSSLPFLFVDIPIYDVLKLVFVFHGALSTLFMYGVINKWTNSSRAALIGAFAYGIAPYHLLNANYRGAVGEYIAMTLLPLFFFAIEKSVGEFSFRNLRKAIIVVGAICVGHVLSLITAFVAGCVWLFAAGISGKERRLWRDGWIYLFLMGSGVLLVGFYSIPLLVERVYLMAGKPTELNKGVTLYQKQGLFPRQLVERRGWSERLHSYSRKVTLKNKEMPFYFGISLLVFGLCARGRVNRRVAFGAYGVLISSLLFSLYPFDVLLSFVPGISSLQYPWRFLSLATCAGAILIGLLVAEIESFMAQKKLAGIMLAVLVVILAFDSYPYLGASGWHQPYEGFASRYLNIEPRPLRAANVYYPPSDIQWDLSAVGKTYPEYLTQEVAEQIKAGNALESFAVGWKLMTDKAAPIVLAPRPYAEFLPDTGLGGVPLEYQRSAGKIEVYLPQQEGLLLIKEQWFPGWTAMLDNEPYVLDKAKEGFISVKIPESGEHLTLVFSRFRWDRLLGLIASLLVISILLFSRGKQERCCLEERYIRKNHT